MKGTCSKKVGSCPFPHRKDVKPGWKYIKPKAGDQPPGKKKPKGKANSKGKKCESEEARTTHSSQWSDSLADGGPYRSGTAAWQASLEDLGLDEGPDAS